jgi:aspartate/methionine/tyrosine aminotransferase
MPFSRRTHVSNLAGSPDATNALSRAVAEAQQRASSGEAPPLFDLTVSNPTSAGLPYDSEAIVRALASPNMLVYEPEPLGLTSVRRVVASEYQQLGIDVDPSRIAITSSTSEAYAVLFKMFCDPGDEVLVPIPSYPLLAWLAAFEGVVLRTYPLEYAGHWHVDVGALARAIGPRTRLVVVVSPNNPTGSFLGQDELEAMLDLDVPIVSDEVFATYPLGSSGRIPAHRVDSALRARRGLVFALSGLSKLVGLPQMKLGWIACGGARERSAEAMQRLETVLDAYLSVGAPVQHALPELLRAGQKTADAIRARTRSNLGVVREAVQRAQAISVLEVEGGWYVTLRVPETRSDEEWALALVEDERVYVHPGYFFDMTRGAHLVVSLLTPEDDLREGIDRIVARVEREV